MIQQRARN
jgi:hypothetical protein